MIHKHSCVYTAKWNCVMSFVDEYSAESSSESDNSGLEGEEEREFPVSGIERYMFKPEWSSDDERTENPMTNLDEKILTGMYTLYFYTN